MQSHEMNPNAPSLWESSEDALVIGRNRESVETFAKDPRWKPINPNTAQPWTDDYTNLVGAMISRIRQKAAKG